MICRSDLVFRIKSLVGSAYTVERTLGQGGVGRVVQASNRRTHEKRAIKITSRQSDPSGFEISLMMKLDHPNIVRVFEIFEEPSAIDVHLAVELCRGGPLPSYAKEFWPPLEEAAAAVIMWQLLGALHYLCTKSLSHGDVCPANVLMLHFDKPPEQNVTKLIDFGSHAGQRTHDLPSAGLVMRALLGWCCGMKGTSLREANTTKAASTFVYSEGGLGVSVSRAAADLMARCAGKQSGAERDASFTAEKALRHAWFVQARKGNVPARKARAERRKKEDKDKKPSISRASSGTMSVQSSTASSIAKNSSPRAKRPEKDSGGKESPSSPGRSRRAAGVCPAARVPAGGWWGSSPRLESFVPRLRAFCAESCLVRTVLIVAADTLDEEALSPLRAAFLRLDGWCPDGMLTVEDLRQRLPKMGCKDPPDLDRLLVEADIDGVGALDFTAFVSIAVGAKEVLASDLGWKVFQTLDRDQDGVISTADLSVFMSRVASSEEIFAMLAEVAKLDFAGFSQLLQNLLVRELDFSNPEKEWRHQLSPSALERLQLAAATSEGTAHPERGDTIKAKLRVMELERKKRQAAKEKEERRKQHRSKRAHRKRVARESREAAVEVEQAADPLPLSLIIESSQSDSSEGTLGIEEDSAVDEMGTFRQMLHENRRLLISL
ncbi:unnamed protein product [Effrenium voratum]|nr:unnamed protein product [Effrenium voratum]